MTRQTDLPDDVAQAIRTLLDYLWDAEKSDFDAALEESQNQEHLFRKLELVAQWLGYDPEA